MPAIKLDNVFWKATHKLNEHITKDQETDCIIKYVKLCKAMYGKIIRPHGSLYVLLCFNNENKIMEAIYKSAMEEGLGSSLQIKSQNELLYLGRTINTSLTDRRKKTNTTPLQQSDDILDGVKLYFDTMDQMDLEKQTPTPTPTTSSSIKP
jgi:hypothetical protein